MAPIRRYLRITKYSVLEVRIYLEKPSDAPWLLSTRDPVLPRVIEEVRPKVLPKLWEENENARKKGGKKKNKGIRDVAGQEDFEVVMFLTEGLTRHSLITKQKQFASKPKIRSTGNKLTGWLNSGENNTITVEDDGGVPNGLREEGEGEGQPALGDIPEATGVSNGGKRKVADDIDSDGDPLFVSSDDEGTFQTQRAAPTKRRKQQQKDSGGEPEAEDEGDDDKKKLALNTTYDGFSIYGRILCLIVKRKGMRAAPAAAAAGNNAPLGGSQMMEQWVSTQVAQDAGLEDDEDEG